MTSAYPGALDALTNPVAGDMQNSPSHSGQHTDANDAIEAIQAELGTDPAGAAATVKARLTAMDAVDALRVVGSNATTAPSSPVVGQVWVDHSTPATPVIKVWSGSAWVNPSSAGSGGAALVWATVTGGTVTTVVNPDGSTDEVHTFTADGTLTVTAAGYAQVFLMGGGTGGDTSYIGGGGGAWSEGLIPLPAGSLPVDVGAGGAGGGFNLDATKGKASTLAGASTQWGTSAPPTTTQPVYTTSIDGTAKTYGLSSQASPRANRGDGGISTGNTPGSAGVVIVRVKVTPAPALPAATGWAQVTGGTVTEYTKPDGSVMEVHTFTATGSNLTVVAAGYAECLVVSGGTATWNSTVEGGGRVRDGLWPLPAGVHAVTVGAGGTSSATDSVFTGKPSSIGSVLSSAIPGMWAGSGAVVGSYAAGVMSSITGTATEYAKGQQGASPRVNKGDGAGAAGSAGVVIVAVQKTPPTASGVVASGGTESTFTGDGVNGVLGQGYKVHTFTASGSLIVTTGGEIETLLCGGGGSGANLGGGGGGGGAVVTPYPFTLPAGTHPVVVGAGGAVSGPTAGLRGHRGSASTFAGLSAPGGGGGVHNDPQTGTAPIDDTVVGGNNGGNGYGNVGGAAPNVLLVGNVGGLGNNDGAGYPGGGGGGAGGAGSNAAGAVGGAGGAGRTALISGTSKVYAAGGGGGSRTSTGGAAGGAGATAGGGAGSAAATANTGAGSGGGGATGNSSGAGGSGVVVIRYKV